MKKAQAGLLGWLIIIAIIIYPFVWLHERVGWLGIGMIAALIIGAGICWHIRSSRKDQKAFDELVLYVLHNRLHPDEARKINLKLAKSNFPRSALIRNLQIIRDSIEIALTSKKRDTAESRMNTVFERYQEISREQAGLVTTGTFNEITRVVEEAEREFHTKLYLNLVSAYMDKVEKLKTKESKVKYLQLAKEALKEGLQDGRGRAAELKKAFAQVESAEHALEKSST